MSKTPLTTKTITESHINSLRTEAAGRDTAQVIVCDRAAGEAVDLDDYAVDASEHDGDAMDVDVVVEFGDESISGEVTLIDGARWGAVDNWVCGRLLDALRSAADAGTLDFRDALDAIEAAASEVIASAA